MTKSVGRTVAKNAGALMISQVLTWGLALVLMVFLPRFLGTEGVGQYHLAMSLWAIASMFASFGMDVLLTKEIARQPDKVETLWGTSLAVRTVLFGVTAVVMAGYVVAAGYSAETIAVIAIMGATALLAQYTAAIDAVLRGIERMEFISIGSIVVKAVLTIVSIGMLLLGYGVVMVAGVTVVAGLAHLLLMAFFLNRLMPMRLSGDLTKARWMLKASYPYMIVNLFLVLYMQVDIVIISLLVNEETIGWYAAADQLFGTLLFIPTVFITAVFPALSRMHVESSNAVEKLMSKSFDMLLLLSVPIGLGVIVIATPLVALLFGEAFLPSATVLMVMGVVLILTYQNMLLGQYYISIDKQRFWTWVMAIATLATIPLDLILVPWCREAFGNGAIGGALAFVVTESGMMIAGLAMLPKGTFGWQKGWYAARVFLAGVLMMLAARAVVDAFILVPIVVGAVVYVLAILLLRVVPAEDWAMLRQVGSEIVMRVRGRVPRPANIN